MATYQYSADSAHDPYPLLLNNPEAQNALMPTAGIELARPSPKPCASTTAVPWAFQAFALTRISLSN